MKWRVLFFGLAFGCASYIGLLFLWAYLDGSHSGTVVTTGYQYSSHPSFKEMLDVLLPRYGWTLWISLIAFFGFFVAGCAYRGPERQQLSPSNA